MTTEQLTEDQKNEISKLFYLWLHDKNDERFFDMLEKFNLDIFEVSDITGPISDQYKKEKQLAA